MSQYFQHDVNPEAVWAQAPRYAPGIPFPRYAYVPGGDLPHPRLSVEEHVPDLADGDDALRLAYGADLYHFGYLWEAHEVWEPAWISARGTDPVASAFWQGLIWNTAAQLKARAGRWRGARSLSRKSRAALGRARDFATARPVGYYRGIDLVKLTAKLDAHYAPLWEQNGAGVCGNPPRLLIETETMR